MIIEVVLVCSGVDIDNDNDGCDDNSEFSVR